MTEKTNLGYLSWNPLNWFKERPVAADTTVIRTPAGETVTVPVYAPTPAELPGYIPADTGSGSWWSPFLTTLEKAVGTWANYQQVKSQSARDAQAMQMQYDLLMAQAEAAKVLPAVPPVIPPPVKPPVDWAAIAKIALPIAGIGIGIWLIARKK